MIRQYDTRLREIFKKINFTFSTFNMYCLLINGKLRKVIIFGSKVLMMSNINEEFAFFLLYHYNNTKRHRSNFTEE